MSEPDTLRELRKISKILLLTNSKTIESEISKIATTGDRKRIWVLIDGKTSSKQLADQVGCSQRAVQVFLKEAKLSGFIDYEGEFATRLFDYIPPTWIALVAEGGLDKMVSSEQVTTIDPRGESPPGEANQVG